jgi:hypothetical protein
MTKILKNVMLHRLHNKFPRIKNVSRETSTNNLIIYCQSPAYIREYGKKEEEVRTNFVLKIGCVNNEDKAEPYTEETLEKVLQEFPIFLKNEISALKHSPGFVSFITYNTAITQDELEKDIDQVFNFSTYTIDNDPLKNSAMIKTSKKYPLLPKMSKMSKKKKEKLF